jgi:hypothetical protein
MIVIDARREAGTEGDRRSSASPHALSRGAATSRELAIALSAERKLHIPGEIRSSIAMGVR